MEEGRELYLRALRLRRERKYAQAGVLFLQAANASASEACWEMAYALTGGGGLGFVENKAWGRTFVVQGTKLGHPLCRAMLLAYRKVYHLMRDNEYDKYDYETPACELEARILEREYYADRDHVELTEEEFHLQTSIGSHFIRLRRPKKGSHVNST